MTRYTHIYEYYCSVLYNIQLMILQYTHCTTINDELPNYYYYHIQKQRHWFYIVIEYYYTNKTYIRNLWLIVWNMKQRLLHLNWVNSWRDLNRWNSQSLRSYAVTRWKAFLLTLSGRIRCFDEQMWFCGHALTQNPIRQWIIIIKEDSLCMHVGV